jgi:hypothetical protein
MLQIIRLHRVGDGMFRTLATTVAIGLAFAGGSALAQGEAPPALAAPAQTEAVQPALPVAPSDSPRVAYVVRNVRPQLIDITPAKGAFAVVGVAAAMATGASIVADNQIENPANEIAPAIAEAYARAHGYRLGEGPLPVDKEHPLPGSREAQAAAVQGARYLVDVEPPGQTLIYFPLDWGKFDLTYVDRVRVTDLQTGKVVENATCVLKPRKRPDLLGHGELLADQAAGLKALMKFKAAECATELKTKLKLEPVADATPPAPPPAPR